MFERGINAAFTIIRTILQYFNVAPLLNQIGG